MRISGVSVSVFLATLTFVFIGSCNAAPEIKVDVVNNLAYKDGDALTPYERERCVLDLFIPKSHEGFPVIVWFHGGGLEGGDKADAASTAQFFAQNGIAVATVNYRLSPKATYPAYIDDAAASVAWVANHIAKYGGNPKALFISGHSAGGYLTAILGMDPKYLAKYGIDTAAIAGIIPVSGQTFTHYTIRKERGIPNPDTTPIIDDASPCYHARKTAPPTLAICGDHDMATRAEENRYFVALLNTVGHTDATYREFPDRDHGTIVSKIPEPHDPVAEAILGFVARCK